MVTPGQRQNPIQWQYSTPTLGATNTLAYYAGDVQIGGTLTVPTFNPLAVTVPTRPPGDNTANAANTVFVQAALPGAYAFRNRLINGDMRIDQRHAGGVLALVQGANPYTVDRWSASVGTGGTATANIAQVVLNWAPVTLTRTALQVSSTAVQATLPAGVAAGIGQTIEGLNIADLACGTPNAQTVTVQLVMSATVAGDYFVRLFGGAPAQSFVHRVTLTAATTTRVSFTVPGPTTGTWATDNTAGVNMSVCLGSGATYQTSTFDAWQAGNFVSGSSQVNIFAAIGDGVWITDVQLEPGAVATPFERRAYAQELRLCQRYYENNMPTGTAPADGAAVDFLIGAAYSTNSPGTEIGMKVEKRAPPAIFFYRGVNGVAAGQWSMYTGIFTDLIGTVSSRITTKNFFINGTVTVAAGAGVALHGGWGADAEL